MSQESVFQIISVYVSVGTVLSMIILWICREGSSFRKSIKEANKEGEIDNVEAREMGFILDEISELPVLIFFLVLTLWPLFIVSLFLMLLQFAFEVITGRENKNEE